MAASGGSESVRISELRMTRKRGVIPMRIWNALVSLVASNRILSISGGTFRKSPEGVAIEITHPPALIPDRVPFAVYLDDEADLVRVHQGAVAVRSLERHQVSGREGLSEFVEFRPASEGPLISFFPTFPGVADEEAEEGLDQGFAPGGAGEEYWVILRYTESEGTVVYESAEEAENYEEAEGERQLLIASITLGVAPEGGRRVEDFVQHWEGDWHDIYLESQMSSGSDTSSGGSLSNDPISSESEPDPDPDPSSGEDPDDGDPCCYAISDPGDFAVVDEATYDCAGPQAPSVRVIMSTTVTNIGCPDCDRGVYAELKIEGAAGVSRSMGNGLALGGSQNLSNVFDNVVFPGDTMALATITIRRVTTGVTPQGSDCPGGVLCTFEQMLSLRCPVESSSSSTSSSSTSAQSGGGGSVGSGSFSSGG